MNFYSNEKVNLTGMIVFEVMLTTLVVIVPGRLPVIKLRLATILNTETA